MIPSLIAHDPGAAPVAALRTKVASGVRWGVTVSIGTQLGRMMFLMALMRLLGPQSYGIVGQATLVIAIAQIFVHFGLAVSIVQRHQLDHREVGTAFWLNVAMGFLLAVSMVLGAPALATFFKTQQLTAVVRVLSIALVVKAISIVPTALLTRHMHFRGVAIAELSSTFVSGVVGLGAAVTGAGYWALVIQAVSLEASYLLVILWIGGLPEFSWSAAAARRLWSLSSRVMGADLVNYVSDQSDKFFVARFLGATPLALYSLAFRVLQLTLAVLAQAGRVVLPAFARLQHDRTRLAGAFLDVTESVSLALCPAMTLVMFLAPVGVRVVVGEAWVGAIVPLQIVAAITVLYVLGAFMGPLTIAVGRADWEFRWSIVTMVVALVAFPLALRWGIVGVATAYLITLCLLNPIRFKIIQRLVPISPGAYIRALAPATVCSVALAIVWWLTASLLQRAAAGPVSATIASLTGTATYMAVLRLGWPDDLRRQLDFARLVVRGDRAP